jgi:hypothetical protein
MKKNVRGTYMLVDNAQTLAYLTSVGVEALIVGAVLGTVLAVAVLMYPIGDSMVDAAVVGCAVGIVVHILFEATRANAWYCRSGAACAAASSWP